MTPTTYLQLTVVLSIVLFFATYALLKKKAYNLPNGAFGFAIGLGMGDEQSALWIILGAARAVIVHYGTVTVFRRIVHN